MAGSAYILASVVFACMFCYTISLH